MYYDQKEVITLANGDRLVEVFDIDDLEPGNIVHSPGHVVIFECKRDDGTIVVSEGNWGGVYDMKVTFNGAQRIHMNDEFTKRASKDQETVYGFHVREYRNWEEFEIVHGGKVFDFYNLERSN